MGNVSVAQKTATAISNTFMSMLMESVVECAAKSEQIADISMQAGQDIDIGPVEIDMRSMQKLDCISNMNLEQIMQNFNKQEFESKTKQAVSGFPLGANASVDQVTSTIVNNLTSDTVIRNIQTQIATAKQQLKLDLQAGRNIKSAGVKMIAVVDQAVKGMADTVAQTLQQNSSETKAKSVTDQLVDGFMSGSTITKIVFMVVIGGGLIGVAMLVIKLAFGKKDPDLAEQGMVDAYQDQLYQQQMMTQQQMPMQAF